MDAINESLNNAFRIRRTEVEGEYIITIGNHLATKRKFKSYKEAERTINRTDWDLVAAMVFALKEAQEFENKLKENEEEMK